MVISREWIDRLTVLSLCLLIFALPFSKSTVEVCIAVAIILWILKRSLALEPGTSLIRAFAPVNTGSNLPVYLFIAAGFFSVLVSGYISLSLKGFFSKLLKEAVLFFVVAETINDRKKLDLILIVMILSMFLMSADGIFQTFTGNDFLRRCHIPGWENVYRDIVNRSRPSASFNSPNGFGGWLVVMISVALSIAAIGKRQEFGKILKCAIWTLTAVLMLCLTLTRSRGAWLGFSFAMIFFAAIKKKKIFLIAVTLMLGLSFIAIPCFINVYSSIDRMLGVFEKVSPWNNASLPVVKNCLLSVKTHTVQFMLKTDIVRTHLWREAILIIKDFPVLGCGLNTYSVVAPGYKSTLQVSGVYPHNSYLQLAAEMGIVGLISFVLIIISLLKTSITNMRNIEDSFYVNILLGLSAGLSGFLVHSFFDVNFYALQMVNLMWFIMGLIAAVQRIAVREQDA